jgi:hypothetical protein
LSSAAGTAALPAPPRARVGVIAAAIGGAAVAGAIAFVAVRGATATPAGPAAPPPRAPVIAPAPHPAPPPPAPPAPPTTITLAVRSDPAGADVFRASDGMRIGTTPFDYAMPASDGDLVLIVKKAGFDDGRVAVRADRDRTIDLPLARTPVEHVAPKPPRHPHASGSGAGSGTGAPRPVDGSLDPFDHVGAGP